MIALCEWSLLLKVGSCSSWMKRDASTMSRWCSWGFSWREDDNDLVRSQYQKGEITSKKGRQRGWYDCTLDGVVMTISASQRKMVMMSWCMLVSYGRRLRYDEEQVGWSTNIEIVSNWWSCAVGFTWQNFDELKVKERKLEGWGGGGALSIPQQRPGSECGHSDMKVRTDMKVLTIAEVS